MAVADGLLVLLRAGARHGYQLKADFEERTAGTWPLNTGQVYTTLDRLVRDGFVEAVDEPDEADARRRPYRLTELGRERAAKWLALVDGGLEPPRDDLTMRVLLAYDEAGPGEARRVIDAQRQGLLERLRSLRLAQRTANEDQRDDPRRRMAADSLAVRTEAELRWLDLCDERIQRTGRR